MAAYPLRPPRYLGVLCAKPFSRLRSLSRTAAALGLALAFGIAAAAADPMSKRGTMSGYDFAFTSIDGRPLPLAQYRGRPVLVVNTASFCGFTPQYEDLEVLW